MYYFGGSNSCCSTPNFQNFACPMPCGCNNQCGSNFAIILVLFILLVIVIGSRINH